MIQTDCYWLTDSLRPKQRQIQINSQRLILNQNQRLTLTQMVRPIHLHWQIQRLTLKQRQIWIPIHSD